MINKQAFFLDIWSLENLESTQEARSAQDVTLTLLLYSLDFPRVSITRYSLAKHEPILIEKMIIVKSQETLLLEGVSVNRSSCDLRTEWI